MRFLFVYQDYGQEARRLLEDLGVRDVKLIIVRKNSNCPTAEELEILQSKKGADVAICSINRKYRKSLAAYVSVSYEAKIFRFEDRQLRQWLVPKDQEVVSYVRPSEAFRGAAVRTSMLILHADALKFADSLAEHRWRFASASADLLARYALGESLGPLRDWRGLHGIDFAANGRTAYKYEGSAGSETRKGRTEWHLKEGDHTSPESAARIYFARVEFDSGVRVVVFYVGPHPKDGERLVSFWVP